MPGKYQGLLHALEQSRSSLPYLLTPEETHILIRPHLHPGPVSPPHVWAIDSMTSEASNTRPLPKAPPSIRREDSWTWVRTQGVESVLQPFHSFIHLTGINE